MLRLTCTGITIPYIPTAQPTRHIPESPPPAGSRRECQGRVVHLSPTSHCLHIYSSPHWLSSVSPGPTTKRPPSKAHTKKPSAPHASTKHPVVLHPPSKPVAPTPTKPVLKPHHPRTPLARDNVMVDMYLRISGNNIGSNIKVKQDVEINT